MSLKRTTEFSAGYDLPLAHQVTLEPGQWEMVTTTWENPSLDLQPDTFGFVHGRSGLGKRGLGVTSMAISPLNTGPVKILVENKSLERMEFDKGNRVAQVIPIPGKDQGLFLVLLNATALPPKSAARHLVGFEGKETDKAVLIFESLDATIRGIGVETKVIFEASGVLEMVIENKNDHQINLPMGYKVARAMPLTNVNASFRLLTVGHTQIEPQTREVVETVPVDFIPSFPKTSQQNWFGFIQNPPETLVKVNTGIIDSDYTGRLLAVVENESKEKKCIPPRHHLADIVLLNCCTFKDDDFINIQRGDLGFGASGLY